MTDKATLFTREELLGGGSARRATALLGAIENRTAQLVAQSRLPNPYLPAASFTERNAAFLGAIAAGRDAASVTIQEIERHAPAWAALLPERRDPSLYAGLARLLGKKYRFAASDVPQLHAALGLAEPEVRAAFERQFRTALDSIFVVQEAPRERLRWRWSAVASWAERLPAFWLAFFVTLIIGAVNLALPIAVAGVGALPGVALIVALGLVNMITVAAMVEIVMRSGSLRYGTAFIGTIAADYLGQAGSAILSAVLTAFSFGLLLIFYIGISTTLADVLPVPAPAWMIVLFMVGLYFLSRGSLNATIASTIIITTINIGILLTLTLLAFTHLRPENLLYVNLPWSGDRPVAPGLLGALIGVILDIYSAHILVAIFGKKLLQRDPSGRSVVRGHMVGIAFAMLLNAMWVLAVCGAVAPEVLAAQSSTVLAPLAATVGPLARVLGAIFVILSMGLGSIQFSLALFNLARERVAQLMPNVSRGRFLLALTPVILVLLVAEWMVLTGTGSFAGILGFLGVMVHSLMSGIFPALLLVASRRKGELVPGVSYRFLGHPLLIGAIYLLFLGNLFLHGLVIWQHPLMRAGGVFMGLLIFGITVGMARRGAFARRAVVELRHDQRLGGRQTLNVVVGGEPLAAEARVEGRQASVALPATGARELKLWAHRITPVGDSEPLDGLVEIAEGNAVRRIDLGPSGMVILPFDGGPCEMRVQVQPWPTNEVAHYNDGQK
jgi:amino acid permease